MVNVSICILNYNGKNHLENCLKSIPHFLPGVNLEKLLIDNASSDDSWKIAKNYGFRVIHADNRYKFITGLNTALLQFQMDYILFSQADLIFKENCISTLIENVEETNSIIQPIFYNSEGAIDNAGMGWIWPGYGIGRTDKNSTENYRTDIVTSITFITSSKVIERVGLFDEQFSPAYYEDVDYSLRARKEGVELLVCPTAKVLHNHTSSFSKSYSKTDLSSLCTENRLKLIKKHYLGTNYSARLFALKTLRKIQLLTRF